jgi:hypothetical protein
MSQPLFPQYLAAAAIFCASSSAAITSALCMKCYPIKVLRIATGASWLLNSAALARQMPRTGLPSQMARAAITRRTAGVCAKISCARQSFIFVSVQDL